MNDPLEPDVLLFTLAAVRERYERIESRFRQSVGAPRAVAEKQLNAAQRALEQLSAMYLASPS